MGDAVGVKVDAKDCHTFSDLQAWRNAQLAQTHYVPEAYRAFSKDSIERAYRANVERIIKEQEEPQNQTSTEQTLSNATLASEKQAPSHVTLEKEAHDATTHDTIPPIDASMLADKDSMQAPSVGPFLTVALFAAIAFAFVAGVKRRNTVNTMPTGYLRLIEEP